MQSKITDFIDKKDGQLLVCESNLADGTANGHEWRIRFTRCK